MAGIEDFIDCTNKQLSIGQLFKLLLVKVGLAPDEKPAVRVCVSNVDELGGLCVTDFTATGGETSIALPEPIRKKGVIVINGSFQHGIGTFVVGATSVTGIPALPAGVEVAVLT